MKISEWQSVAREALHGDPGWKLKSYLVYQFPVGYFLIGFQMGTYSHKELVRVYHLVLPLFYPLRRGQLINYSDEVYISKDHVFRGYQDQVLQRVRSTPSVNPISSFSYLDREGLTLAIRQVVESPRTEANELAEYVTSLSPMGGMARLILGDVDGAVDTFRRVLAGSSQQKEPQQEILLERAVVLLRLLEEQRPTDAIAQVDRWVDESLAVWDLPPRARLSY
jgi:hypothetical protein